MQNSRAVTQEGLISNPLVFRAATQEEALISNPLVATVSQVHSVGILPISNISYLQNTRPAIPVPTSLAIALAPRDSAPEMTLRTTLPARETMVPELDLLPAPKVSVLAMTMTIPTLLLKILDVQALEIRLKVCVHCAFS